MHLKIIISMVIVLLMTIMNWECPGNFHIPVKNKTTWEKFMIPNPFFRKQLLLHKNILKVFAEQIHNQNFKQKN